MIKDIIIHIWGLRDAHIYPLVARRKGQSFRGATRRKGNTH